MPLTAEKPLSLASRCNNLCACPDLSHVVGPAPPQTDRNFPGTFLHAPRDGWAKPWPRSTPQRMQCDGSDS
eukprot:3914415-Pyramimonas_sp.AAC.1